MKTLLGLILGSALVSGCVSTVSVESAKEASPGLRYYLPEVFIKVTPKDDGTFTVEKIYLPDPKHEYVVNTNSFLGNYTIDISRTEQGFLDSVTYETDTTAVAKQLAVTAGNLRSQEIDAKAAAAKAEATDAKAAADKAKAALDNAQKAYQDAELTLKSAQEKLRILEERVTQPAAPINIQDQILAARIAVRDAELKRDTARLAYTSMVGGASTGAMNAPANSSRSMNAPTGTASKHPTYPDPVFYRVEMEKDTVKLREAFARADRETWKPVKDDPADAIEFSLTPAAAVLRPAKDTMALSAEFVASHEMVSILDPKLFDDKNNLIAGKAVVAIQPARVTLRVDLDRNLPKGKYRLDLGVKYGKPKKQKDALGQTLDLTVEK